MNERDIHNLDRLEGLYRACCQGEDHYRAVCRVATDGDLKYLFSSYSLQRGKLAREVGAALAVMGWAGTNGVDATAPPPMNGHSCAELLAGCVRREEEAIEAYRQALAANGLPEALRAMMHRHLEEICLVRERLDQLHELARHPLDGPI